MVSRLSIGFALVSSVFLGLPAWASDTDPLQIFVSKQTQTLVVYDGDKIVATSNVSTGKPGHTTPSGIFSILEKQLTHFSNKYDDAPMPFMQRITWDGVALHESASVPDYPASHGCVRLPRAFAKQLYGMTKRGFHVVITNEETAPHLVSGEDLFLPRYPQPSPDLLSDADFRPALESTAAGTEVAMADTLPKAGAVAVAQLPKDQKPIRILITRASDKDKIRAVQSMLDRLGYAPGDINGIIGQKTRVAIKAYQAVHSQTADGEMTQALVTSINKVMGRKPLTGWLYVRQNFKPVFDTPVTIQNPEIALGTHFLEAVHTNPAQNTADWYAASIENDIPAKTAQRLGIASFPDINAPDAAETALARIDIPSDLRLKIESMLGNGSSLTITDTGTAAQTGPGTDFITVIHEPS
jgi:peptidoglycan hydrolase-like protein with peptidoglycan-binding domain